jgi:lipoate-protein ligase A
MAGGRKIVGSAQRRIRRSFLQHGSMPITCNREVLARATRLADASSLDHEMAGVAEFLPERPTLEQLTGAFIRSFQDHFGVEFRVRNSGLDRILTRML